MKNSPGKLSKITPASVEVCQRLCEGNPGCRSITYFLSSGWCSHFSTACTNTKTKSKAASARLFAGAPPPSTSVRLPEIFPSSLHLYIHPYVRTSTRPSSHLSTHPAIYPSIQPAIKLLTLSFIHPSIHPSIQPSSYHYLPPIHPSVCPSTRRSICLSNHPHIHPRIYQYRSSHPYISIAHPSPPSHPSTHPSIHPVINPSIYQCSATDT